MNKGLLSLTASTLLISSLSAMNTVQSASIDLKTYAMVKIVFDDMNDSGLTAFRQDVIDGNITVENNTTDDNVSLRFFDYNVTNKNDSNVTTSIEMYLSIPDVNDTKIIRGNTYNNLVVHFNDADLNDSNRSADFNLTKTLGTLNVTDNAWNLVTMPAGVYTNAREMIKANKATMIWGWDLNSSAQYNWTPYPDRMEPGRGYWVRTRISNNTGGSLGNIVASDYNLTSLSDYNTSMEVNVSNFAAVISMIPKKEEWVLLGNSGADANISSVAGSENNTTKYFFENLLNSQDECYFVSIYHWDATNNVWINDSENGEGYVPANAGVWVKQRLCNQ